MSAEELRRMRDAEYMGRRLRRGWEAALGGRWSLPAPLVKTRMVGGVQPPPIGVVPQMGEVIVVHMPGALVADTSDPYPVVVGGAPFLQIACTAAPTGAELDVLRNGVVVDTISLSFTGDYMEYQVAEVYVRGDFYVLDLTDPGTGGDGAVFAAEFRASLT